MVTQGRSRLTIGLVLGETSREALEMAVHQEDRSRETKGDVKEA